MSTLHIPPYYMTENTKGENGKGPRLCFFATIHGWDTNRKENPDKFRLQKQVTPMLASPARSKLLKFAIIKKGKKEKGKSTTCLGRRFLGNLLCLGNNLLNTSNHVK